MQAVPFATGKAASKLVVRAGVPVLEERMVLLTLAVQTDLAVFVAPGLRAVRSYLEADFASTA